MNDSVFLSIIIPMYNTGDFVKRCLESLNNQTCKDFEAIVVDDGSSDNSYEIAKEYLETSKLNYRIYKQQNSGVSSARNFGMDHSNGKYLYFLDSDDFIDKEMVSKTRLTASKSDVDIIFFGYDKVDEAYNTIWNFADDYKYIEDFENGKVILKKILNKELRIFPLNVLYRREVIFNNNLRYPKDCHNGEDQNFIFKAVLLSKGIMNIKEILGHYLIRNTSISNSFSLRRLTLIKAFEDVCDFIEVNFNDSELIDLIRKEYIPINLLYNISGMSKAGTAKQMAKVLKDLEIRKYLKLFVENKKNDKNIKLKIYARAALLNPTFFAFCLAIRR
jgi:glycosyltransferase involved in cell wall biosynthesis